jgi:hypothetical protein
VSPIAQYKSKCDFSLGWQKVPQGVVEEEGVVLMGKLEKIF